MYSDTAIQMYETQAKSLYERAAEPLRREPSTAPKVCLSRAPVRLDVVGGIAEYSGATVLGTPLADGIGVAVQRRGDARVAIYGLQAFDDLNQQPFIFDLGVLAASSQKDAFAGGLPDALWVKAVAGAIHAMLRTGKIDGSEAGLTVVVDGSLPALVDMGTASSVAVAVIMAATAVWDLKFDPEECVQLAVRAENDVVGHAAGIGAAACALHAQPGALTRINCRNHTVEGAIPIPAGLTFLGIDTGFKFDDADEKYNRARTATLMGSMLIERMVNAFDGFPLEWLGSLSRLGVEDYKTHLRDRVPTRIKGSDFLQRVGDTSDPLSPIEPDRIYKIRSRLEHHIYEAERTHRFAERIAHFDRTGDRDALVEAGVLMYASHWSYGQRCGLGSVETDRLVTLLRERGTRAGIYGARVTAQGSGGVVVVMLDDGEESRLILDDVVREYARVSAYTPTVYEGSSVGAIGFGVHAF